MGEDEFPLQHRCVQTKAHSQILRARLATIKKLGEQLPGSDFSRAATNGFKH
jgi:hypothetical protein